MPVTRLKLPTVRPQALTITLTISLAITLAITLAISLGLISLVLFDHTAYSATRSDRDSHMVQCKPGALKSLFDTAYKGDTHSQFALALMYSSGHCLKKSLQKSNAWLWTAAHHGHRDALYTLAVAYHLGDGVKQNLKRARVLFKRAAKNGHIEAQHQLGMNLLRSKGNKANRDEGLYWLGYAAANGHALSALIIGRMHELGSFGIDKNICQALDWYEAGLLLGQPAAKTHLARLKKQKPCSQTKISK